MEPIYVRWERVGRFREDFTHEMTTTGVVEVPSMTPIISDQLKQQLMATEVPRILEGYKRELAWYRLNIEGTRLEFKFVDVEQRPDSPDADKPVIVGP